MSEQYESLKKIIASRLFDRSRECVNEDSKEKVFRAQGAARELEQLMDEVERLENPQEQAGSDPEKTGVD